MRQKRWAGAALVALVGITTGFASDTAAQSRVTCDRWGRIWGLEPRGVDAGGSCLRATVPSQTPTITITVDVSSGAYDLYESRGLRTSLTGPVNRDRHITGTRSFAILTPGTGDHTMVLFPRADGGSATITVSDIERRPAPARTDGIGVVRRPIGSPTGVSLTSTTGGVRLAVTDLVVDGGIVVDLPVQVSCHGDVVMKASASGGALRTALVGPRLDGSYGIRGEGRRTGQAEYLAEAFSDGADTTGSSAWLLRVRNPSGSTAFVDITADYPGSPPCIGASEEEAVAELLTKTGSLGYSCRKFTDRDDFDPFEFGAIGAVWCGSPADSVTQLAIFRFPDATSLEGYWRHRITSISVPLLDVDGGCTGTSDTLSTWTRGEVACFVSGGRARIRWTNEDALTYGVTDATDSDLGSLVAFWNGTGDL